MCAYLCFKKAEGFLSFFNQKQMIIWETGKESRAIKYSTFITSCGTFYEEGHLLFSLCENWDYTEIIMK